MEFGIFTDEGLLEGEFSTRESAEAQRVRAYADDEAYVAEICPDHPEFERFACEACDADDE